MTSPKFCIVSADKTGSSEGMILNYVLHYLGACDSYAESDVVVVPLSRMHHFTFNDSLRKLKKPWVLMDYVEYGANDWDRKSTHLFGDGTFDNFTTFNDWGIKREEWKKFDEFAAENPPMLTFKRELLRKDVSNKVIPIEYPCYINPVQPDSPEAFNKRLVEVLNVWGHSNEGRVRVHGEIFKQSSHVGYEVVSSWDHLQTFWDHRDPNGSGRVWATIYTPSFARVPISDVMAWNARSKLSLSMPGAGVKCFRHAEAPVNSTMVMQEDNLAWSYPWVGNYNCIKVPKGDSWDAVRGVVGDEEVPAMALALQRPDLYDIYRSGLENVDCYRSDRYAKNYIIPNITEAYS